MSVCTVDGQRYSLGDVKVPFTLQSVSKPFTYAICLNELGPEIVHNYISHEPSGRNFNEITLDKRYTFSLARLFSFVSIILNDLLIQKQKPIKFIFRNKPHNPMLNSGAIISSSVLLEGMVQLLDI